MSSTGNAKPRKSKAGKRKKKKDPNAPKRPRSAYILYCTEKRSEVKAEHPDAKPAELMRIMGELWNSLAPTKKQEYTDKAKDDKARYNDQMKDYSAPEPESDEDERPSKRQKGKKGKKKRDPMEPKRSPSAYLIYGQRVREKVKGEHPDAKSSEIMKIIGQMWQKLSEEEKKPYNDEAATAKAKYDVAKQEYKKNKAGGGHRDEEDDHDDGGGAGGAGSDNEDDDGGGDDDDDAGDDDGGGDDGDEDGSEG